MSVLLPGLADSHMAQATFRAILDAVAHPGRRYGLPRLAQAPGSLSPAAAITLLTLVDATTPVALPEADRDTAAWLTFHTGAPTAPAEAAAFVLAGPAHGSARPVLASLRQGTFDAPEASATLLLDIASLTDGAPLTLSGPGIAHTQTIAPTLDAAFVAEWRQQGALFPRGVDVFLLCGAEIVGLPRSTCITEA
ncbi:phosphonate C-P lyase system protein PhnH [Gluconacetobacter sp. 1c LMG 22058]|uniref:Phosphonate C-P lyase system protein PhnH n=2 Tax=Gluconacetobacter dulcium TaxID=2729096 RepID=A0A7W4JY33_9PROT|nr:phosphonate C-P lyase system protein PhnH [Gluconacetobacter dulcium]